MGPFHEAVPSGRQEPSKHQLEKAVALVKTYFPDIAKNRRTRHFLRLFLEDAALQPEERDAIERVVKGGLNGTSDEILDRRFEGGDMLLGQPVDLVLGGLKSPVQNPH